jgi:hypothetical protein
MARRGKPAGCNVLLNAVLDSGKRWKLVGR